MKPRVELKGFAAFDRALGVELPRATERNAMRRAATEAMAALEERMRELAPERDGDLAESIATRPVKARRGRGGRYARQSGIAVATGPTSPRGADDPGGNAAWQEFGTVDMAANPYVRPAADEMADEVLGGLADAVAAEVGKAAARIAKKAARSKR